MDLPELWPSLYPCCSLVIAPRPHPQATDLSRRIDAQYSGVFVGVALPHAEGGAAGDSDAAQLELRTALPDPAELSEASFGELGRSAPKVPVHRTCCCI
jgi:hypothetical protein